MGCFASGPKDETAGSLDSGHSTNTVSAIPDFGTRWKSDIADICSRSMEKLPAHIDVPRLCKKIIVTNDNDVVFDGKSDKFTDNNNAEVTRVLLSAVAETLGDDELLAQIKATYDKMVVNGGDIGSKLASWFADTIQSLGGETPTLLMFKTVHQQCIFPGFYCMRNILEPSIGKFKDKRGSWHVNIDITSKVVTVSHTKRQQSQGAAPDGTADFEFNWVLSIPINREKKQVDQDSILISLSNLECASHLDKGKMKEIAACLDENKTIS